jgi:hypothetical protein
MTADLLREAAGAMRRDAAAERVLREGDPYYAMPGEASRYELAWYPLVALAVADWLDTAAGQWANYEDSGGADPEGWSDFGHAATIARAYLGRDT